jgi:ferritin-like protein
VDETGRRQTGDSTGDVADATSGGTDHPPADAIRRCTILRTKERLMSKARLGLLRGIAASDLADGLDRLYCYEQLVARWCGAVERELTGFATFVLPTELGDAAKAAAEVAERLAARIAALGGEPTADAGRFVERSPLPAFELPRNPGDVAEVLTMAIAVERVGIAAYAGLVVRVGEGDAVTHRMLTGVLAEKLVREDELEGVLTRLDALGLTFAPRTFELAPGERAA